MAELNTLETTTQACCAPGRQTTFKPLPFDADAARALGSVAASLRRAGRKTTARAYDAMIAATAVANDLPIYTCNPTDFNGIDGLDVVAIPVPDAPSALSAAELAAQDPEKPQQPS
jgi:hypothetical protein